MFCICLCMSLRFQSYTSPLVQPFQRFETITTNAYSTELHDTGPREVESSERGHFISFKHYDMIIGRFLDIPASETPFVPEDQPCPEWIDVSDDDEASERHTKGAGAFKFAPSLQEVKDALKDMTDILKPPQNNKRQAFKDPGLDKKSVKCIEDMQILCRKFIDLAEKAPPNAKGIWQQASIKTSQLLRHTKQGSKKPRERRACDLRKWIREFISDQEEVPICKWQTLGWLLIDDKDFSLEIHAHLQSLKPDKVKSEAIVHFLDNPEMLQHLHRTKTISIPTAQKWMHKMNYHWTYDPKGQDVDGHEREDVVNYHKNIFLPTMEKLKGRQIIYSSKDGSPIMPPIGIRQVVVWYHDKSTFYAHDQQRKWWVHQLETAKPYKKGKGPSEMVAEFCSAEYGFLHSLDGKESTHVLFKAGKERDGYFGNEDIRKQTAVTMEICKKWYPNEDHIFIFDNAKTHTKRAEDAQSALHMPKGPSQVFGLEVNDLALNGSLWYETNGKIKKKKVKMGNGTFQSSNEQQFYHPHNAAEHAGWFKGMAIILQERDFQDASKMKAQCGKKFSDCLPGATQCCCRQTLFNEPNFMSVESILKAEVHAQGFDIIFLPKFHCKLILIEQCWGFAKWRYQLLPESTKEANLERNIIKCLDEIPLISMRWYACFLSFLCHF